MNCKTARRLMALLVRHDLSPSEAIATEDHLKVCKNCHFQFTQLQSASAALESYNTQHLVAAPRSILSRLQTELETETGLADVTVEPSRWHRFKSSLLPITIGAALFLVGIQIPEVNPTARSVAPIGQRIDLSELPDSFVPVYQDSSWQSLQSLERASAKHPDALRNVGY